MLIWFNKGMKIKALLPTYPIINNKKTSNFGSNSRVYCSKLTNYKRMETTSWMFREDIDWSFLACYLEDHFKDKEKVQILNPACSDGSEAYSLIIMLKEQMQEKSEKFFPIKAYDIDDEILRSANSGFLNTNFMDRTNIRRFAENSYDYFRFTNRKLEIMWDRDREWQEGTITMKATKKLTKNVIFNKGDMREVLKNHNDESNTVLMCRNVFGHLGRDFTEKFIKQASEKLKKDSLLVIGKYDEKIIGIKEILQNYGFREINRNIYLKTT